MMRGPQLILVQANMTQLIVISGKSCGFNNIYIRFMEFILELGSMSVFCNIFVSYAYLTYLNSRGCEMEH